MQSPSHPVRSPASPGTRLAAAPPARPRLPAVGVRLETRGGATPLPGDGGALLAALRDAAPDVVLLSNALTDRDALRVLRALRASGLAAAVTFERRPGGPVRPRSPLVAVVGPREDVAPDRPPADSAPSADRADVPAGVDDAPLRARYGLSARECAVARLVATGHTNREVASLLHLSPFTARNHTSRVLRKLGARNRARVAALLGG